MSDSEIRPSAPSDLEVDADWTPKLSWRCCERELVVISYAHLAAAWARFSWGRWQQKLQDRCRQ